jgi:predicted permease
VKRFIGRTVSLWRNLVHADRVERDLDEELRAAFELLVEERVRSGMPPDAARRAARVEWGSQESLKDRVRDARAGAGLDALFQDIRYALRQFRRAPGFTAVAVATLALGIGANSAVFSVIDAVLLRPLPYPAPDALVFVTGTYPKGAFAAMRQQLRTTDVAAYVDGRSFNMIGLGENVRLSGALVSAELFAMLGVQPALGRTFQPGEDIAGRDRAVMLSHALWEQRFGSDPAVIGRSVELDGVRRQIIAVMPAELRFPSARTQLWIPLHYDARDPTNSWASDYMPVVGRLRAGSTVDQARAEVRLFQSRVRELFPWRMPAGWNADVSVIPLQRSMVSEARPRLILLFGAVTLVLLIACANVANLALARAATREREVGIRAALGAGPRRIARQLLTESVLLASLGALLGVALAAGGVELLKFLLPAETPRLLDVHVNWRVLAFTGALAVVTGCLFGLGPVLHASRASLARLIESSGRGDSRPVSERLRSSLTIAQIALAVLLVIGAGLLIRSLWTLSNLDPGFRSAQIVTARLTPNASLCGEPARCLAFYTALEEQARSTPGTTGAALVSTPPLGGLVAKRSLQLEGFTVASGEPAPLFWLNVATPDYFPVMGIPIQAGRLFTRADLSGHQVAIVPAATARRFWPDGSAVGKQVRFVGEQEWRTVIGVVADVRAYDLTRDVPAFIAGTLYVPYTVNATQEDGRIPAEMTLVVRTIADASHVGAALRGLVSEMSREVVVSDVKPMQGYLSEAIATPASTASLFMTFAGLALVLGSIGVYGVLSFLVSKRTREIGVRLALGARASDILWLIMKEGAKLYVAGIALGIGGAVAISRLLSSELHGVSPVDPITYGGVALVVALVSLVACYVPTRRAIRVDPLVTLRDQ